MSLVDNALAPSTGKSYQSGVRLYERFAFYHALPPTMPPSVEAVVGFVAYMVQEDYAASTIGRYLCAVRDICARSGLQDVTRADPLVERVVRAARKRQAKPRAARFPVTAPILARALECLDPNSYTHAVYRFAWCLVYALLLRMGEAAPNRRQYRELFPRAHQWRATGPNSAEFTLLGSKTDVFRDTITLSVWRTDSPLCPIAAYERMVSLRGRPLDPADFLFGINGAPLYYDSSVRALRHCLVWANNRYQLGIDPERLGGHSLRRGAASWLARLGFSDTVIQWAGRWRSWCFRLYIEQSDAIKRSVFSSNLAVGTRVLTVPALRAAASLPPWSMDAPGM